VAQGLRQMANCPCALGQPQGQIVVFGPPNIPSESAYLIEKNPAEDQKPPHVVTRQEQVRRPTWSEEGVDPTTGLEPVLVCIEDIDS
jgi:hypothetical protein